MKHIPYSQLTRELRYIDEGETVMLHNDRAQRTSSFIITSDAGKVETVGLAVKVKGKIYTSDFFDKGDPYWKAKLDTAMQQVAGVKALGWHRDGEKMYDDEGYLEDSFACAYCGLRTTKPTGPCVCRRVQS
jgi:hypothetical protein